MADELIDIVDEQGKVLKQMMKQRAHEVGALHKTVIGSVRGDGTWTFVKQAGDRQDAGQLVSPVGGHIQAGESEENALRRETEEEIGVTDFEFSFEGRAIFNRHVIGRHENHMFIAFIIRTEQEFKLNHESVDYETFTDEALTKELENSPERFGDAFYFLFEHFYPEVLPTNYKRRFS